MLAAGVRVAGFAAALAAEWLKARRSKVPVLTFAAFTAAAGVGDLFMLIVMDPGRARRLGLLQQKTELSGLTADWHGMLEFLAQVIAVGGLLLFAFVATWVFAREFVDGTARYLMALPVPRATIVAAKFTLVAAWCLAAAAWLSALMFASGWALRLPGWSPHVAWSGLGHALGAAALLLPAVAPVAMIASISRGYLAPLAAAIGALVFAQVAAVLGWAAAVPWSIPAVAAGLAPDARLSLPGLLVLALTGVTGVAITVRTWRGADIGT